MKLGPGPNFIELLKQKILLNIFLLSKTKQDTSYILYIINGNLAGLPYSGNHNFVVLSNFLCF